MGEEGNISNLCQYEWYEWCYYQEQKEGSPYNREVLGRVLRPARGEGNEMAQWILKANGNVVPRRTSRPLQVAEKHSPTVHKHNKKYSTDHSLRGDMAHLLIRQRQQAAILTSPIRKIGIITRTTTKCQTSYQI
jgi:hypothetical protein